MTFARDIFVLSLFSKTIKVDFESSFRMSVCQPTKEKIYSLSLEPDHGITHEVIHAYHLPLANHVGVLANQQPTNVGEEKASTRIMRVGIGFRESKRLTKR